MGLRQLMSLARELEAVLLFTGLPTPSSEEAAGDRAEQFWSWGLQQNAGLVINRAGTRPSPSRALGAGFLFQALIPEQNEIAALDERGLPWAMDLRFPAARQLQRMARQLCPGLFAEGSRHVA
jgi:hypothetical protein